MGKQFKILLCDDSGLVRKKLSEAIRLCSEDIKILEAKDGNMAVDMYKEHRPDLMFLDIVMPEKDGITALEEICRFDENAKVIMASSTGTQLNLKRAIDAGAVDFIQKPWQDEVIKGIIHKYCSGKEDGDV